MAATVFPRSEDRGPIEASVFVVAPLTPANFRDLRIAAQLKPRQLALQLRHLRHFRDLRIAAQLKRDTAPLASREGRDFRDLRIAAQLKPRWPP